MRYSFDIAKSDRTLRVSTWVDDSAPSADVTAALADVRAALTALAPLGYALPSDDDDDGGGE